MKLLVKRLNKLSEDELINLSEAIDCELERRLDRAEGVPESARRRAVQRTQSYRQSTGASALPVIVTGLRENRSRRRAA